MFDAIRVWRKREMNEALQHRNDELQQAKRYRESGDWEGVKRSLESARQWHRTYRDFLE